MTYSVLKYFTLVLVKYSNYSYLMKLHQFACYRSVERHGVPAKQNLKIFTQYFLLVIPSLQISAGNPKEKGQKKENTNICI